jgi:hypothetical protein
MAGGMWTVWVYSQTAKQRADAAQITAQKPFSAERLEVYEKLVTLTAAVAETDLPQPTLTSKRRELDQVVNGPLALVAHDKVFAALNEFYACLNNGQCARGNLSIYSRNVARACRSSLEESWKVRLPPVPASDALP